MSNVDRYKANPIIIVMKPYNNEGTTKGEEVRTMFNTIAPAYDKLNHILSMQIDKVWRARVVRFVERVCGGVMEPRILDVATGTADLAILMARRVREAQVLGVDPSDGMLRVGEQKVEREGLSDRVTLRVESAEELTLDDKSYDVVTAAFGVRNFSDLERGLSQMVRVTKRGGWVVVLEFSTPPNRLFRWVYNLYSRHILPRIGALLSKDRKAYEYLPASVEEFASPAEFCELMERVGLVDCESQSQFFGVAQIYKGKRR